MRKKLKHSKFKNTGILFELLVRQVTADILAGKENSAANGLLSKFFAESTSLGKELKLYQLMLTEKAKSANQADHLIDLIVKSRIKISNKELAEQKFNLIKEIKDLYPISDFLRSSIPNYRELASIYKIFEECSSPDLDFNPKELFQARNHLVEHITQTKPVKKPLAEADKDALIEYYQKQEQDLRLLSYKLLVDSFNKKYSVLDSNQKTLLKEYINNVSNTNSLKHYIDKEVDKVKTELVTSSKNIKDNVIKIKLKETISQLDKVKVGKIVKDNHIMAMLLSYELLKEIKAL